MGPSDVPSLRMLVSGKTYLIPVCSIRTVNIVRNLDEGPVGAILEIKDVLLNERICVRCVRSNLGCPVDKSAP
jgi:hypothetical protein